MSRAHNARQKAKRKARAAAARTRPRRSSSSRQRVTALAPVLLVAAILAIVGVLGFGSGDGPSKKQIEQEVAALLGGIPQSGSTLGFSKAPFTVWVYADLECPTVRLFVENYLPPIIDKWVRTGIVKLDYRSLQTDTSDEQVFFDQEVAALAAGRQERMWNFALTFVRQQEEAGTDYVTEGFLTGIGSQMQGLDVVRWHRDRGDALLIHNVVIDGQSANAKALESTPALLYGVTDDQAKGSAGVIVNAATRKELASDLRKAMSSLGKEAFGDEPTVGVLVPD